MTVYKFSAASRFLATVCKQKEHVISFEQSGHPLLAHRPSPRITAAIRYEQLESAKEGSMWIGRWMQRWCHCEGDGEGWIGGGELGAKLAKLSMAADQ